MTGFDTIHDCIYYGIKHWNLVPDKVTVGVRCYKELCGHVFNTMQYTDSVPPFFGTSLVYWYDAETEVPIEVDGKMGQDDVRAHYNGLNGIQRALEALKEKR